MRMVPFSPPLSAFDQDSGVNSPLTYAITSGNADGLFSIDAATGLIYQTKEIDREALVRRRNANKEAEVAFSLEVEAQQANNPLRAARARVEVAVEDVNDEVPLFTRNEYNVTLREDERVGKRIITVEAKDKDKVGRLGRRLTSVYGCGFRITQICGIIAVGVQKSQNFADVIFGIP